MQVYIAGPISNTDDYVERFAAAQKRLEDEGHTALNPCKPEGFDYKQYIDMGLAQLAQCNAIYMLNGWPDSKGAYLEYQYARAVGMPVLYEWKRLKDLRELARRGGGTVFYIVNRFIDDTGKPRTIRLKKEYETLREAQDFLDSKLAEAWTSEHDIIEMTPTMVVIDWFRQGFRDVYEVKKER